MKNINNYVQFPWYHDSKRGELAKLAHPYGLHAFTHTYKLHQHSYNDFDLDLRDA